MNLGREVKTFEVVPMKEPAQLPAPKRERKVAPPAREKVPA